MARKKTVEECIESSKDKFGQDTYDYTAFLKEGYTSNKVPVPLLCKIHNHSFTVTMNDHLGKKLSGCPVCGLSKRTGRKIKRTFEDVVKEGSKKHKNKYTYKDTLTTYAVDSVLTVVCPFHGEFSKPLSDHMKGGGCQICSLENKRISQETINKYVEATNLFFKDKFTYSSPITIKTIKDKIQYLCPIHGEVSQSFEKHFILHHGCNRCSKQCTEENVINNLLTFESDTKDFSKAFPYLEDKLSINPFKNFLIKNIYCKKHKLFYDYCYHRLFVNTQGLGCPQCSNASSYETKIKEYVESLTSKPILQSSRPQWLQRKELDIYVPSLNFAIEFNGTAFHHSSVSSFVKPFFLSTTKDPKYHFQKWKVCFENNVKLLSIYDFYWNVPKKQEIYKSKIRHFLGLDRKVYARKTEIREIANKVAYQFYEDNHIEGKGYPYKNAKSYALLEKDCIIMCATIGDIYSQSTSCWKRKLQRICTQQDVTVVGGVSKLTQFLKKEYYDFTYQITLSSGGTTLNTFNDYSTIAPRYFWVDPVSLTYYHRNYCQKGLLEKHFSVPLLKTDTENTFMERLGFLKVFDNGLATLNI